MADGGSMASFTVEKHKTAAGVIRYRCIVSVKKDKAIVYQESGSFGKLTTARPGQGDGRVTGFPWPERDAKDSTLIRGSGIRLC
jgi:hypothetical protein